jgi:hypothetical protein
MTMYVEQVRSLTAYIENGKLNNKHASDVHREFIEVVALDKLEMGLTQDCPVCREVVEQAKNIGAKYVVLSYKVAANGIVNIPDVVAYVNEENIESLIPIAKVPNVHRMVKCGLSALFG